MKARNTIGKVLSAGLSTLACALITACGGGGGGGSDSGPSAVETDVLVADIDGDGRSDVLTLAYRYGEGQPGEGRLVVYRQVAAGAFAAPETYVLGCYPWSMTLADVDGDGRPDLVVADPGSDKQCSDPSSGDAVHLMLQDPTRPGRFLPSRKLIGDVNAYQAAVGDFNGDGAPDIAAGGSGRRLLRIQDPARRGEFSAPIDMAMPGQVADIVAGDIDGDGRADLFAHLYLDSTGYTPNSVLAVLLQQPGGLFGAPLQLAPQTGLNVQQLALGDADGDGRPDLIAHFTPFSADYQSKLTVLLQGASALSWSAPVDTSLTGINGTDHTAFGDLNADGRPDVVLVGVSPVGDNFPEFHSQANVFLESGAARFRPAAGYGLTGTVSASAVGIGDVDGDGRNDLVLFGDGNVVMVMLQSHSVAGGFEAPKPIR